MEFHETRRGHIYYERQLPRLIEALEKVALELNRLNDNLDLQSKQSNEDESQNGLRFK